MKDKEEIMVGIKVIRVLCRDCPHRYADDIVRNFSWPSNPDSIIGFDRETNEITVNEQALMQLIQKLNPMQGSRKIRLVSGEEK